MSCHRAPHQLPAKPIFIVVLQTKGMVNAAGLMLLNFAGTKVRLQGLLRHAGLSLDAKWQLAPGLWLAARFPAALNLARCGRTAGAGLGVAPAGQLPQQAATASCPQIAGCLFRCLTGACRGVAPGGHLQQQAAGAVPGLRLLLQGGLRHPGRQLQQDRCARVQHAGQVR